MHISKRSILILFHLSFLILAITGKSGAESNFERTGNSVRSFANFLHSWSEQDHLTGDWGGFRDKLRNKGIDIFGYYDVSVLGNPVGGERKGLTYSGLLNIYLELDLEKLVSIKGLRFRMSGSWASGRSLTEDFIGNFFNVSSIFAGNEVRLYQFYLAQSLFDDIINVAVGRMATGDEFMTLPIFKNFVSFSFDQNPASVFFNIPSLTVDPTSTWGARAKVNPVKEFYAMFGAYDSNPDSGRVGFGEFEPTLSGDAFLIGELGYALNGEEDSKGLPGNYKIGGYYDTGKFISLSDPEAKKRGNYGFYLVMEQMAYREGGPESDQGLTPFATFTLAPSDDINTFPFFFSSGLVYKGLFPGRDNDTTSFGFAYGKVSEDRRAQDFEILMELTYIFNITPWLSVQPDIQYVIHPGGSGDIPNALVVGFGMNIDF